MCSALIFIICHCSKAPVEEVKPVILKSGTTQVSIGWLSREPYRGSVFYKPAGTEVRFLTARESPGKSSQHEVTITGLKPGTRYSYRVGQEGKPYQFQTQPALNKPFTFMMLAGDVPGKILKTVQSEIFDFLIFLDSVKNPGRFAGIRAAAPVFDPAGPVKWRYYDGQQPGEGRSLTWKLDWAGLRLLFIDDPGKMADLLAAPFPHTFGIITHTGAAETFKSPAKVDNETLRGDGFHKCLITFNQNNPANPASFVFILGWQEKAVKVDGIQYIGIPAAGAEGTAGSGKAIRVDVDLENIRAVFLDEDKEIVLRMPPLKGRRTCLECRRLADKGAYRESIKAYKEFIENNAGHYQVDDAYFAIAEIYDEKLFLFNEALTWYQRLIDEYPAGSLTPLARQRRHFLNQYPGDELNLLRRFEQIRKIEYSRKRDSQEEQEKLLAEVAAMIKDYPGSKLAPVMQFWLANRLRQFSTDKAIAAYRVLKEKYPGSDEAKEAGIEIGATYYNAGLYKEALKAYRQALLELPGSAKTINSQIKRTQRNIRRDVLAVIFLILAAVLIAGVILLKPLGLDFTGIGRYILVFIILFILLSFAAWLIHEQFPSTGKWVLFALLFSLNAALSSLLSANFAAKTAASRSRALRITIGSLMGIIFFAAGFYLIIYYINVHFLVLFKL